MAVQAINEFTGDNHLCNGQELQEVSKARREQLWNRFYEDHVLPAAQKGHGEVAVRLDYAMKYFPSLVWNVSGRRVELDANGWKYLGELVQDKGLSFSYTRGGHSKGAAKGKAAGKGEQRGGSLVIAWRQCQSVSKSRWGLELCSATRRAQEPRRHNVWAKFFKACLLPHAQQGIVEIYMTDHDLRKFFKEGWQDDVRDIAETKAVAFTEGGHYSVGWSRFPIWCLAWREIKLMNGKILRDSDTGIELMKIAADAQHRQWQEFFKLHLLPVAEKGLHEASLELHVLQTSFPWFRSEAWEWVSELKGPCTFTEADEGRQLLTFLAEDASVQVEWVNEWRREKCVLSWRS